MKPVYYVENITSTNFILGTNTKSMNLRIHELVIFNQTTKIDAHEEKYFDSIFWSRTVYNNKLSSQCSLTAQIEAVQDKSNLFDFCHFNCATFICVIRLHKSDIYV